MRASRRRKRRWRRQERIDNRTLSQPRAGEGIGWDDQFELALNQIQTQGDYAQATADEQQALLGNEYFDPNDPFSRQAMASRAADLARKGRSLSAASRGRMYSGSQVGAARDQEYDLAAQQNELIKAYQNQAQGIDRGLRDTQVQLGMQAENAIYGMASQTASDIGATQIPPVPRYKRRKGRKRAHRGGDDGRRR